MVFTADKGLAMVVLDKEDHTLKAQSLLADDTTHKTITRDPTNKLKNHFPNPLGTLKTKDLVTTYTEKCTPPVQLPLNFMAFPKYIM